MQQLKIRATWVIELIKIVLAICLTFLLIHFAFEIYLSNQTLDIHFHDTYFLVDPVHLYLIIGSPIYYFIQLIHLSLASKVKTISFVFFAISGLILGGILWLLYPLFELAKNGFTSYPPLSNLNSEQNGLIAFSFPIGISIGILAASFLWICIKFVWQKKKRV